MLPHPLRPATLLALLLALTTHCGGSPPPPPVAAPLAPAITAPVAAATVAAPSTPPPPAAPLTPGSVAIGDVVGPPQFDPKGALADVKPQLLRCYTETRTLTPDVHGKLVLQIRLNEAGAVLGTDALAGGRANDPGLIACIADAMKTVTFPKPGGSAVITVPLVFRQ